MKTKAISAFKMLAGGYTPYLRADWGEAEGELVSGWIKGANYPGFAAKLEGDLASRLGSGWTVRAVNQGRSAIILALAALGLPEGAEVMLPSYGDATAATAVMQLGLKPYLIDVDEQLNMRYESVFECASKDVRALVISHLGGCWARDFDRIMAWTRKKGVWVIEDARDAQGLVRNGGLAGTFGDIGVFSASGARGIVSSGGGWLVTRNPKIGAAVMSYELEPEPREMTAARLDPFIRNYTAPRSELAKKRLSGSLFKRGVADVDAGDDMSQIYVYEMSGVEARLIMYQMPRLQTNMSKRVYHASRWRSLLAKLPLSGIRYPAPEDNIYTALRFSFALDEGERESQALRKCLSEGGVETELSYVPLHLRSPFDKERMTSMDFANHRWRGTFCAPVWVGMDDSDWKRIETALNNAVGPLMGK